MTILRTLLEGFAAKPGPGQYRCDCCGGVFDKGQTEKAAEVEFARLFPEAKDMARSIICDECFVKMGFGP